MKLLGRHIIAIVLLAAAVMVCVVRPANAAEPRYRLEQLYRLALERAEQIAISREDVVVAELNREKAWSVLRPGVALEGNYRRYSENETLDGAVVQPDWDSSYGVTIGQSITLNGRELTALRIAEDGIDQSRHDLAAVREGYLIDVAEAFFEVAKTRKAVEIAAANVTRLTAHRDAVVLRLKLNEVTKTELFRTEAELASAGTGLIRAQNGRQLALAILARLVGLEAPFDIIEDEIDRWVAPTADLSSLQTEAMFNRAEMKSLRLGEKIAADQVKFSQGAYWPRLSLEGSWTGFDQSSDADLVLDDSAAVGLRLDFQLYDGGLRRAEVSQARSAERQIALARADTARQITLEVEEAWRNVNTQQGVISSLTSQLRYARENYTAVTRLFEHGMANSVDVMDANTLLVTAERQLSEARYDLRAATLRLDRAGGTFLEAVLEQLKGQGA